MTKIKNWYKTKTATTVTRDGDTGTCKYHDTVVVEWTEDRVILDLGGWDGQMTRLRMNQVAKNEDLSFTVYRSKKQTYVRHLQGHECNGTMETMPFGGEYQETVSFPRFQDYVEDCPDCAIAKLRSLDD